MNNFIHNFLPSTSHKCTILNPTRSWRVTMSESDRAQCEQSGPNSLSNRGIPSQIVDASCTTFCCLSVSQTLSHMERAGPYSICIVVLQERQHEMTFKMCPWLIYRRSLHRYGSVPQLWTKTALSTWNEEGFRKSPDVNREHVLQMAQSTALYL